MIQRVKKYFISFDCCQFGSSWIVGMKMELMVCAGLVGGTLAVQRSKAVFLLNLYDSINDMEYFQNISPSHLSRVTAIFVVDGCQFGPSWMFIISMIWNSYELSTSHHILPWSVFTDIKKAAWATISNTQNVYLVLKIFEWYLNIMMTIMNEYSYIK